MFAFLDQDSGKVNSTNQSECSGNYSKAFLLKNGFRLLDADFFNDTKVILVLNSASYLLHSFTLEFGSTCLNSRVFLILRYVYFYIDARD